MAPRGDEDSIIVILSNRIKELEEKIESLDKKTEYLLQTQNDIQKRLQERKE